MLNFWGEQGEQQIPDSRSRTNMSGSDTEDNQLSDEDAAIEILARLDQLIQRFGDTKGLSESS